MKTKLNPYINFKDSTREAMQFHKSVFGGELTMRTFKEFHAAEDPQEENLIMHAMLEADNGMTIMAADTPSWMEYRPGNNFNISLSGDNEAELSGYFLKLSEGGTVTIPLEKAMWGDAFGMCVDKFGISWLANISPAKG